jgi:hypothetical protein
LTRPPPKRDSAPPATFLRYPADLFNSRNSSKKLRSTQLRRSFPSERTAHIAVPVEEIGL